MVEQIRIKSGEMVIRYHINDDNCVAMIIPGLGYSKTGPYFLLSNIARELYQNNVNTIIFDYYGLGDSLGNWNDITYESLLDSVKNVFMFATDIGYQNIILIGLGIGNVFCNEVALEKEIRGICLIDYCPRRFIAWKEMKNPKIYLRNLIGLKSDTYIHPVMTDNIAINNEVLFCYEKCSIPVFCMEEQYFEQIAPFLNSNNEENWSDETQLANAWDRIKDDVVKWTIDTLLSINGNKIWNDVRFYNNENRGEHLINVQGLLGILKLPHKEGSFSDVCIIYEPGLGGDRIDYMSAAVKLSMLFSNKGCNFFRYDFYGCGVSKGEFYKFSWSNKIKSLNLVITFLKEKYLFSKFIIISYSEGAKVAIRACKENDDVVAAVMWSPVLMNGMNYSGVNSEERKRVEIPKFIKDKRRGIVLATQAYFLGIEYFSDQKKYQVYEDLSTNHKPLKIIYGQRDDLFQESVFLNSKDKFDCEAIDAKHLFSDKALEKALLSTGNFIDSVLN